jgi:class 3 adenylate cyclase/tetratricopeptide (TPR) repeat protein
VSQSPGLSPNALIVLRDYLPPEPLQQLEEGRPVSAAARVAAAAALRAELAGLISYLPPSLARRQLADPRVGAVAGRFWAGTALFADLSGFTALSSALSGLGKQGAEEISAIINTLFDTLLVEVDQRAGNLLKFGGDALTAFFAEDDLGAAHAALACDAALAMQRAMERFADLPTLVGRYALALRIGVHSGRVFAAEVGDRTHLELVVTGRTINRVAAAQEVARPGEIVVTPETLALAPGILVGPAQGGFLLLRGIAAVPPAPRLAVLPPAQGSATADLVGLAERVAALRPYLPHGLPARYLMAAGTETGEFRPVSVLFANVHDFSELLERLDDDAATATHVLNAYFSRAQAAIHRYGGVVNKVDMYTHGDKLMALFGAPVAHEDDPLRAVRCALELSAVLDEVNGEGDALLRGLGVGRILQRIGINTGVVFAGRIGSSHRHEYTVMGSPVNLAARLMAAAADGTVVLSPATRRAVESRVAVRELPPAQLKGIPDPVAIVEAVRLLDPAAQSAAPLHRGRLVGRDEELVAVVDAGVAAAGGAGRVVALVGEPGSGKSRLAEEAIALLTVARPGGALPLVCGVECQSYEQSSPYAGLRYLLRQILAGAIGVDAAPEAVATHVAAAVPELARFAPLIGDVLGVALPDSPLTAALTPEQRHDNAQALCVELLLRAAPGRLLILLCDDLQWADASTLDVLAALAARAAETALLLLLLYRSDSGVAEPWSERCATFMLRELSEADAALVARTILGAPPPPQLLRALERAQGNPFFVEELVRSLVETGALRRDGDGWALEGELDAAALPDSIESLMVARLDRLEGRSRELVQVAAVVGRRFRYEILSGLMGRRDELRTALESMVSATLLLPDELERELAYLFKYALTRDVAYESILYARRHDLHRRVAQQIERLYAGRLEEQLAVLAGHYLLAQAWPEAFDYHLRAGRLAQRRYANQEGIFLLEHALRIGERIEAGPELMGEIQERLGWLRSRVGDYETALGHFFAALTLLGPGGALDAQLRLHHHIARIFEKQADFDASFRRVEQALQLPGADGSPVAVRALLLGAGLFLRQGRYGDAQSWGERALVLAQRHANESDQAQALKLLGNIAISRGDTAAALDLLSSAVEIYRSAEEPSGLGDAHNDLATVYHDLGRFPEARANYEEAAQIKAAIGDVYGQALIAGNLGELLKAQGDVAGALAQYERAVAGFERLGSRYGAGIFRMNRGAAHLLLGDLERAEMELGAAGATFAAIGADEYLAELERYLAELALRRGNPDARALAEQALASAIRLEARLEEGITRRLLAEILGREGDHEAAWAELERSLALLREAEAALETARTLLARAALAPALGRHPEGLAALAEARDTAEELGAEAVLDQARAIGQRYPHQEEPGTGPSPG